MTIRDELFNNRDLEYQEFHSSLIPNVDKDKIIGVRIPVIRKIAKKAAKDKTDIDPYYYEELMIKGMIIGYSKLSINEYINMLDDFVPLIDNWAVCDCCVSTYKFTVKYKKQMFEYIKKYLSKGEYEVRFAIVMILDYFIDDDYIDEALNILKSIKSDLYYVNTAVAWALCVAAVKYYDKIESIIKSNVLSVWVHNKTIQKCCESYRISNDTKKYLKSLKRQHY